MPETRIKNESIYKPQLSPASTTYACVVCSRQMSLNDFPAHLQGRKHQIALNQVNANLSQQLEYAQAALAATYDRDIEREDLAENNEASLAVLPSRPPKIHGLVRSPVSFLASRTVARSAQSTEATKQAKGRPNRPILGIHSSVSRSISPPVSKSTAKSATSTKAVKPAKNKPKESCKMKQPENKVDDPLQAFFTLYTTFKHNRLAASYDEFRRLCSFFRWPSHHVEPDHKERKEAWEGFRIAMVKAFNLTFGHDECDIEAWGRMCALLHMEDIPEGLEARRLVT